MDSTSRPGKSHQDPNPLTRLLRETEGSHGTFDINNSRPGSPFIVPATSGLEPTDSILGGRLGPSLLKRATATAELAEGAGVKRPWLMYLSYYIPCIAWIGRYRWNYFIGDLVAGGWYPLPWHRASRVANIGIVTMASFYIPMALSLSANLAHLPPIHGLYAFAIQPLVWIPPP